MFKPSYKLPPKFYRSVFLYMAVILVSVWLVGSAIHNLFFRDNGTVKVFDVIDILFFGPLAIFYTFQSRYLVRTYRKA